MPRGVSDYSKAKVYRLSCPDGYFYIGHTCLPLSKRKSIHKTSNPCPRVREHFDKIGWGLARMEVIEDLSGATDMVDVLRAEDRHIKQHLDDPKCLNCIRATLVDEPERPKQQKKESAERRRPIVRKRRNEQARERRQADPDKAKQIDKDYKDRNRDSINKRRRELWAEKYSNDEERKAHKSEYDKQYREDNKESITQRKKDHQQANAETISERRKVKVTCDKCGAEVTKQGMTQHKKTTKCINFAPTTPPSSLQADRAGSCGFRECKQSWACKS